MLVLSPHFYSCDDVTKPKKSDLKFILLTIMTIYVNTIAKKKLTTKWQKRCPSITNTKSFENWKCTELSVSECETEHVSYCFIFICTSKWWCGSTRARTNHLLKPVNSATYGQSKWYHVGNALPRAKDTQWHGVQTANWWMVRIPNRRQEHTKIHE